MPRKKSKAVSEKAQKKVRKPAKKRASALPSPRRKMRDIPSRLPQEICPYENCKYRTFWASAMSGHRRAHRMKGDPKPFPCSYPHCNFRCDMLDSLKRHEETHELKQAKIKIFQCSYRNCPYGFTSFSILSAHEKLPHPGMTRKRVSSRSRKSHERAEELERAKKRKPGGRHRDRRNMEKKYKCKVCDYRGVWECEVRRHADIHKNKQAFKCNLPGCDFKTTTVFKLAYHKKKHNYRFFCSFPNCGYKTVANAHLVLHESRHKPLSERPKFYSCTYPGCYYCALSSSHLTRHIKTHAAKLEQRQAFQCSYCPRKYVSVDGVKRHEKLNHPEETGSSPLFCSFPGCSYRTDEKKSLTRHEDTHVRVQLKPYSCSICHRRYNTKDYVARHMKTHNSVINGDPDDNESSTFEADADEDPQSWVGSTQQVAAGSTAAGAQASGSPPELSNEERTCKLCGFIGASDSALLRHSVRHKRVTVKLFKL